MKIITINGSHKGENGNTDEMVKAFIKGAENLKIDFIYRISWQLLWIINS